VQAIRTDPAVNALIDVDLELRRGEWLSITAVRLGNHVAEYSRLPRPATGEHIFLTVSNNNA